MKYDFIVENKIFCFFAHQKSDQWNKPETFHSKSRQYHKTLNSELDRQIGICSN